MKYRVESISGFDNCKRWKHLIEYTDNRNAPLIFSDWAKLFLPHFGLVINNETGAIEYKFGAYNPDWIKWALEKFFESLPTEEALK